MDEVMGLKGSSHERVAQLLKKGVEILAPTTVDVGQEVNLDHISGSGVRIYPGCRIYGKETVISTGCQIGREGPATIENCRLGRDVELKGGYFSRSIFLERASMGLGAHVREGCILEEEANGAHCVGIKQTILFPFVTLGSLINFCDCLMAGGRSRKDHSEVGSSYIHFNFTPDGDKATPSLIGDVPRGVMLNQPPIFLGGQGGIVGPVRIGYGNVAAANSVLRNDYIEENMLIVGKTYSGRTIPFTPRAYAGLRRIVTNNILYLANLMALRDWYLYVRRSFLESQEFGELIFLGLLDVLDLARDERLKRLKILGEKARKTRPGKDGQAQENAKRNELSERFSEIESIFAEKEFDSVITEKRDDFLARLEAIRRQDGKSYIEIIQGLPDEVRTKGVSWLQGIVDFYWKRVRAVLPLLDGSDRRVSSSES